MNSPYPQNGLMPQPQFGVIPQPQYGTIPQPQFVQPPTQFNSGISYQYPQQQSIIYH